ncbi:NAD(P)/FAD-dependent oxidoreductase [Aspergillus melleus]|uniref:NAD(P)/FAD-dependent oxidoreductase n=1 Tax=Aspergillus melleus TaxID=138277 RepID=UPI001E8EE5CB|nr:uncharacterized protein LDX57_001707 [Aspergillus melleus]KAH8423951.1 hypothetical protein LDX57_001707 [Aspergillus melleus]
MMSQSSKLNSIVIIGAGVFGLSTALELSERGYTNITVFDRRLPPVPDGSSVDVSRIIRPDYADVFYARMGLDAMKGWNAEYAQFFHRSGLLCAQSKGSTEHSYLDQSKQNLESLGASVTIQTFQGNEATERHPGIHGDLSDMQGYWNTECGWADAEGSITHLAQKCSQAGISFLTGKCGTVNNLIIKTGSTKSRVVGVRTAAGTSVSADTVILATGAWTPYLIDTGNRTISTGQPVAFVQLTPEEAKEMQNCPVMINLSTGWFAFPPTPGTNLLKMARHGYGFETTTHSPHRQSDSSFSAPKMSSQSPFLPADAEKSLREGLALFLPRFKDRPFVQRRLCWYTDTPKGDFIVDYHPEHDGLFLATGGSGHAFKFLPVLGRYVADSFERKASQEQRDKWAWTATANRISKGDGSRGGPPRRVLLPKEQARL